MKILVVEDEKRIAQYIKKGLELKSYIVDVSHDGLEGLSFAMNEEYDLLILDRMLPGMEGTAITKQLRDAKKTIPILLLTAKTQLEDKVEGLDSGADDYLTKPFAFEELLARVRALSRRPQKILTHKIVVSDLQIDPTSYQVSRNGQTIELSKKEYALLEFLARHKGQVFTKEQLAEKVWSFDSDILANTVQVYIGYVRTKIDAAFPTLKPLIHTVRGFGYKIDVH